MRERTVDQLPVQIFESETDLARAAARHTAEVIKGAVDSKGSARVAIATGNSQLAFVAALQDEQDVPWHAVTVYHLDEYVGMDAQHPAASGDGSPRGSPNRSNQLT